MSLYPFFDKHLLFPIAERYNNSGILKSYDFLKMTEWWSRKEIENYRDQRLSKLIHHCYQNVPYYTDLFDKINITPDSIQSVNDLNKIPILTKEIIRSNYDKLRSKDINDRIIKLQSSGGSTGKPLKFITDMDCWNSQWATTFRAFDWANHSLGDKIFTIGGHSVAKKRKVLTKAQIWDKYLMRNFKYSGSEMNDEVMAYFVDKYNKLNPKAIRGYASSIYVFANYIERNKIKINQVDNIFTTGEVLIEEYRKKIQEIFQAPVYDEYGAGDGGIMCNECYMHEGLHVSEENCIIEIYKDGQVLPDGETGHVLTTDLNNYAFPFIRYQAGDMAYYKNEFCSCGRKTKLIGEVMGRAGRLIYSKKGVPVSPTILLLLLWRNLDTHSLDNQEIYNKIDRFQACQDKDGDITVKLLLKNRNEDKKIFEYIIDNYKNAFKGSKVQLEFVNKIDPLPSGKEDYVISHFNYNA